MKRTSKLLLGVATIWPLIYLIISLFLPTKDEDQSASIIALNVATFFLCLFLIIFYIINIFKNENVPQEKKLTWTLFLFLLGIVVFPLYWYWYIWLPKGTYEPMSGKLNSLDNAVSESALPKQPPDWRGE